MAEKEVKLRVITETEAKDVEDLEDKLNELKEQRLQIQLETHTEELEEVNSQIEETQAKLDELKATPEVDDSEIQALEDELSDLEARRIDLEIAVNTDELEQAKSSMDELEEKSVSTGDAIGSAFTAVAGAAGLDQMITTADNINNSWNRLELTFKGTGVSIDELKQKQAELQSSTGQTGGAIRSYFNMMGIAGVTNVDLLTSSFEALSGKAYQTGQSVEEIEGKFQRMVMTGNASGRMLTSLGISAQDLANAMGVSADQVSEAFKNMTPEERIQALTKAMGDGKEANEMYKNSFQGLKTQAEAAFAGLVGAVGQAILPFVIPLLTTAKDAVNFLTNAFKSLPGPVQALIGGFGAAALVAATLFGVLGTVGTVVKTLKTGIEALSGIMKIWKAVTEAVKIAQAALNFVMEMNPIFLVIAAVVALIAILWYLYNTNEDVRNAIDGLGQALWGLGETIYGYLLGALEWLKGAWQNTVEFFQTYGELFLEVFLVLATGPIGAIGLLIANMNGMPNQLGGILQNAINRVISFASNFVSNITKAATNAVSRFINQIRKAPGELLAELNKMVQEALDFASRLPQILWDAGKNAVSSFLGGLGRHSPGTMQREMIAELTETANAIPGLIDAIGNNLQLIGEKANEFGTQVTDKISNGMPPLMATVDTAYDWIGNGMSQLVTSMGGDGQAFLATWTGMKTGMVQAVTDMITDIQRLPTNISNYLSQTINRVTSFASSLVSKFTNAASNAVNGFMNWLRQLPGKFLSELNKMINYALDFARRLPSIIARAAGNMVLSWTVGSGEHSPGYMYDALTGELKAMNDATRGASLSMVSAGRSLVNGFTSTSIGSNSSVSGGNVSYTFNLYGDIDNEERMQKFIDAVRRELAWNNATAGRTV